MSPRTPLSPATIAAQAAGQHDAGTGAILPPLQPSTTFARDADYALRGPDQFYSRYGSPTVAAAERVIAALDGGESALLFSSGMAGVAALLRSLPAGAHCAVQGRGYYGVIALARKLAARGEITLDLFDPRSQGPESALRPGVTRVLWLETPSNPGWDCVDIAASAQAAHAAGALLAVDATVATPVFTRPLSLGADIVFHAATKAMNGHSDVLGGALVFGPAARTLAEAVRAERDLTGAMLGAFEAWLLIRGLRTLDVRMRRAADTALTLAQRLAAHPRVVEVLYPGLPTHPTHAIAARQMTGGFGSLLSLRIAGGAEAALGVLKRLRLFQPATSLGGVESLVEHRASVEGPGSDVPADLLRVSVGIEAGEDLLADFEAALA